MNEYQFLITDPAGLAYFDAGRWLTIVFLFGLSMVAQWIALPFYERFLFWLAAWRLPRRVVSYADELGEGGHFRLLHISALLIGGLIGVLELVDGDDLNFYISHGIADFGSLDLTGWALIVLLALLALHLVAASVTALRTFGIFGILAIPPYFGLALVSFGCGALAGPATLVLLLADIRATLAIILHPLLLVAGSAGAIASQGRSRMLSRFERD